MKEVTPSTAGKGMVLQSLETRVASSKNPGSHRLDWNEVKAREKDTQRWFTSVEKNFPNPDFSMSDRATSEISDHQIKRKKRY